LVACFVFCTLLWIVGILRSISRQRPFSSAIDRNRNRPFNLIKNKVGYRSCFATGVNLEQFLWNSFDVKYILEVLYCRPDCALSPMFISPKLVSYYFKEKLKNKETTKNRKFRWRVYMSNELISKIIWRTNFLFGC
jgi:hypothetical protein